MRKTVIRFALAIVLALSAFSATACSKEHYHLLLVVTDSFGNEIEMVEDLNNVVLCLTYDCRDEDLSFTGKFYYKVRRKVRGGNLGSVFEPVSLREPGKYRVKEVLNFKETYDYSGVFELIINVVDYY